MTKDEGFRALTRQLAELRKLDEEANELFSNNDLVRAKFKNLLPAICRSLRALGLKSEANELPVLVESIENSGYYTGNVTRAVTGRLSDLWHWQEDELARKPAMPPHNPDAAFPITDAHKQVLWLCERFSRFALKLKERQRDRPALVLMDEYDAQYALHALLCMHFDDVRPEEPTPSKAGGTARMDFLIKGEGIVIEAKRTRETLTAKRVGEELVVDIHRYQAHPDCRYLICFVYDPDHILVNPNGLSKDLSGNHGKIMVSVVVGH